MRKQFCDAAAFVAAIVLFAPLYSYAAVLRTEQPDVIRVAVAKDAESVTLAVDGGYKVVDLLSAEVLSEGRRLHSCRLTTTEEGFKIGDVAIDRGAVAIEPQDGARVYVDGRVFRGRLKILKDSASLLIINALDLEEYLYGVIRNEVSPWWPMEAIKAQAIAARTYAIFQIRESRAKDYDVTADVTSQVYCGINSERWRTNKAVEKTKGQVLVYRGAIFPAYYHATCGGGTLDAGYLWKVNLPPLKGVQCGWCKKSPHFSWERRLNAEEVKSKIEGAGYAVGDVLGFEPTKKDPSGRILEIRVVGSANTVDIQGKEFRRIIGSDVLRSTNFKPTLVGPLVVFEGTGWGHGVGLCQWGAYYMARAGKKTDEILNFYYPGSKIVDYKEAK